MRVDDVFQEPRNFQMEVAPYLNRGPEMLVAITHQRVIFHRRWMTELNVIRTMMWLVVACAGVCYLCTNPSEHFWLWTFFLILIGCFNDTLRHKLREGPQAS